MNRSFRALAFVLVTVISLQGVAFAKDTVSLDVRNVDIYTVMRMLAKQSGKNIVLDNTSVKHDPVTFAISNVSFEDALHALERSTGLQDVTRDGVVYVGSTDAMLRQYGNGADADIHTQAFHLRFAKTKDLTATLTSALPPSTVIVPDDRTSTFIITGTRATLQRASQIISMLDVPLDGPGSTNGLVTGTFNLKYIHSVCSQTVGGISSLSTGSTGTSTGGGGGGMSSGGGNSSTQCSGDALTALHEALQIQPPNSIVASPQNNAIIATGSQDFVDSVSPIIAALDRPGKQVVFTVRVVDLQPINNSENFGFQFGGYDLSGNPTQGAASTTFMGNSLKINATLNASISHGHGRSLATPTIVVMNNHTGDLLVGETYPISFVNAQTQALQVQFVNIGILLSLTPVIGDNGDITTDLHPQFSSLLGTNPQGIPIISTRQIDTVLRVKSGESIVIAGLVSDILTNITSEVPILSKIPIIGRLFDDKNQTHTHDELVFVITPHIVTGSDLYNGDKLPGLDPKLSLPHANADGESSGTGKGQ
jgi:type II secretory pathway component GspD/PulD (secretin)